MGGEHEHVAGDAGEGRGDEHVAGDVVAVVGVGDELAGDAVPGHGGVVPASSYWEVE